MSHSDKARKPQGHRVTYIWDAEGSSTARCGCGWTYTNSVKSDVRFQASCHRTHTARRP